MRACSVLRIVILYDPTILLMCPLSGALASLDQIDSDSEPPMLREATRASSYSFLLRVHRVDGCAVRRGTYGTGQRLDDVALKTHIGPCCTVIWTNCHIAHFKSLFIA